MPLLERSKGDNEVSLLQTSDLKISQTRQSEEASTNIQIPWRTVKFSLVRLEPVTDIVRSGAEGICSDMVPNQSSIEPLIHGFLLILASNGWIWSPLRCLASLRPHVRKVVRIEQNVCISLAYYTHLV